MFAQYQLPPPAAADGGVGGVGHVIGARWRGNSLRAELESRLLGSLMGEPSAGVGGGVIPAD